MIGLGLFFCGAILLTSSYVKISPQLYSVHFVYTYTWNPVCFSSPSLSWGLYFNCLCAPTLFLRSAVYIFEQIQITLVLQHNCLTVVPHYFLYYVYCTRRETSIVQYRLILTTSQSYTGLLDLLLYIYTSRIWICAKIIWHSSMFVLAPIGHFLHQAKVQLIGQTTIHCHWENNGICIE